MIRSLLLSAIQVSIQMPEGDRSNVLEYTLMNALGDTVLSGSVQ